MKIGGVTAVIVHSH